MWDRTYRPTSTHYALDRAPATRGPGAASSSVPHLRTGKPLTGRGYAPCPLASTAVSAPLIVFPGPAPPMRGARTPPPLNGGGHQSPPSPLSAACVLWLMRRLQSSHSISTDFARFQQPSIDFDRFQWISSGRTGVRGGTYRIQLYTAFIRHLRFLWADLAVAGLSQLSTD